MAKNQLSYCAAEVRRHDNDRFVCTLFAPPREREAMAAVFAFNLEVARLREIAREPLLAEMRLQWWRDTLDGVFAGRPPRHPVAIALAEAVAQFSLSRGHFHRVLEGRKQDLAEGAPESMDDLIDYADATSASLSLLTLEILAVDDEASWQAARAVGIAWALTGLMRAVPFHAGARRVYLPAALNRAAGLNVFELYQMKPTAGLCQVVATIADRARLLIDEARALRPRVPDQALPALLPATLAQWHLDRLRKAGHDPFDARLKAGSAGGLYHLLWARLRRRY
jgi:phytoene synthase